MYHNVHEQNKWNPTSLRLCCWLCHCHFGEEGLFLIQNMDYSGPPHPRQLTHNSHIFSYRVIDFSSQRHLKAVWYAWWMFMGWFICSMCFWTFATCSGDSFGSPSPGLRCLRNQHWIWLGDGQPGVEAEPNSGSSFQRLWFPFADQLYHNWPYTVLYMIVCHCVSLYIQVVHIHWTYHRITSGTVHNWSISPYCHIYHSSSFYAHQCPISPVPVVPPTFKSIPASRRSYVEPSLLRLRGDAPSWQNCVVEWCWLILVNIDLWSFPKDAEWELFLQINLCPNKSITALLSHGLPHALIYGAV